MYQQLEDFLHRDEKAVMMFSMQQLFTGIVGGMMGLNIAQGFGFSTIVAGFIGGVAAILGLLAFFRFEGIPGWEHVYIIIMFYVRASSTPTRIEPDTLWKPIFDDDISISIFSGGRALYVSDGEE